MSVLIYMDIKDLIDIIEKLETRLNSYWNFYTLVIIATAGWLFTSTHHFTTIEKAAITAGLSTFFLANLSIIQAITKRITAFEDELNKTEEKLNSKKLEKELSTNIISNRQTLSLALHLILDLILIILIQTY